MVKHIQEAGEIARITLRNKKIARRDREYFDDAEEFLLSGGRIEKVSVNINGQPGHLLKA
jgi:hypothetical protein